MEDIRIYNIKTRAFMTAWIVLHMLAEVMMLTLLLLPDWVEVDSEIVSFRGSLHKITEGVDSGRSYTSVAEEWCLEKERSEDLESYYYYNAGCEIFWNLSISADIVLVFQIVGILLVSLIILFFALSIKRTGVLYHIFFLSLINFAMQLLGFLVYIFLSNVVLSDECDVWYEQSDPGELCGNLGPFFYLAIVSYLALLLALQGVYNVKHYNERKGARKYKTVRIAPKEACIESIYRYESSPDFQDVQMTPARFQEIVSADKEIPYSSSDN